MRYPYLVYMVVADADVAEARAVAEQELGEPGAGWFSAELVDEHGGRHWAACASVSEPRLQWLRQHAGDLASFRALVVDAETGLALVALGAQELSELVGTAASFPAFARVLVLTQHS